jgi:hypothetical protein
LLPVPGIEVKGEVKADIGRGGCQSMQTIINGMLLEFGVYQGWSINYFANLLRKKEIIDLSTGLILLKALLKIGTVGP